MQIFKYWYILCWFCSFIYSNEEKYWSHRPIFIKKNQFNSFLDPVFILYACLPNSSGSSILFSSSSSNFCTISTFHTSLHGNSMKRALQIRFCPSICLYAPCFQTNSGASILFKKLSVSIYIIILIL